MNLLRAGLVLGKGVRRGVQGGVIPPEALAALGAVTLAHTLNAARKVPRFRSTKRVLKMLREPESISQGIKSMETLGRRGYKLPREDWIRYNKAATPGSTKFSKSLPGGKFYEATPMEKLDIATYGKKKALGAGGLGIGALVAKLLHGRKDAE